MNAARRQDGAVLVEFALVLVPLLLLIFGGLQFGLAMNAKIDSTHLTAEGARYIAVNQNPGTASAMTMQEFIRNRADTPALQLAKVCISYPTNPETGTTGRPGDPVRVVLGPVSYGGFVGTLTSPVGTYTLPTLSVQSEATMRLEAFPTKIPAGCVT